MIFFSSDISQITENLEHSKSDFENDLENNLKSLHCSDDFDFQIIEMNYFNFLF